MAVRLRHCGMTHRGMTGCPAPAARPGCSLLHRCQHATHYWYQHKLRLACMYGTPLGGAASSRRNTAVVADVNLMLMRQRRNDGRAVVCVGPSCNLGR